MTKLEEQRSETTCKKHLQLVPIEVFQSTDDKGVADGKRCSCRIKSQSGVPPICHYYVRYFIDPRGWAIKFAREHELLNECRRYGIYNEVREFANKKATEDKNTAHWQHKIQTYVKLTAMSMSADDVAAIMGECQIIQTTGRTCIGAHSY